MKYLVTSALPYANAELHLGHVLEIVQTDAWVRHKKLQGHDALYFCASDTHGTPIMLKAKEQNIAPEDLVNDMKIKHEHTFNKFNVNLSNFHSTHSKESKDLVYDLYNKISASKHIYSKDIQQLFDDQENIFLADRFVKGGCPKCQADDQYGDACERCGTTYDALDLLDPISTLSKTKPSVKTSKHYFFSLSDFKDFLQTNIDNFSKQDPVKHKLSEWLDGDLNDWDISRDKPYFGFLIPGEEDKYIYVWLDAPVGYLSSIKNWCEQNDVDYDQLMNAEDTKLMHFIGKDIMYFHLLFWPATLHAAQLKQLEEVHVHGFMTIEGEKMSKSRGNFVLADEALNYAEADFYRYYICSKLSNDISDIDFSLEDFVQKVNSDLVGKFINIVSRTIKFVHKIGNGKIIADSSKLNQSFADRYEQIIAFTDNREYSKAIKEIMSIADEINAYISEQEPWNLAKEGKNDECLGVCSEAVQVFQSLNTLLHPFTPEISERVQELLNQTDLKYSNIFKPNLDEINEYSHIIKRLDIKEVNKLVDSL